MRSDRFSGLTADTDSSNDPILQASFLKDEQAVNAFVQTISLPRFTKYMKACGGDVRLSIELYHANARLSQSLYVPLQIWEIALRNRLNAFLSWKFNVGWPYDTKRAVRSFTKNEQKRLLEAIERQKQLRATKTPTTDAIVADLSAGFWVSLLGGSYAVPYVWRYNLQRVFPNERDIIQGDAFQTCESLLDLRNRIAHHEPIFHLPLPERKAQLSRIISAMCSSSMAYADHVCNFAEEWERKEKISN